LSSPGRLVHVVAGALVDGAARVLIAQRPAGRHLAGGWEFPGGKLEPGEERRAGLARELHEELGVTIEAAYPLMCAQHAYRDRRILLDVWVVTGYRGEPRPLDGQGLKWCTAEELAAATLLPADRPIIPALLRTLFEAQGRLKA
jgi:8-oxo-dGTP diphosphatase